MGWLRKPVRWWKRKFPDLWPSRLEAADRAALAAMRDRWQGRRIFVIGNGPSLNQTELSALKDEITIGSNGIFLNFDRMGYLPTYYTVEDNLVAEDRAAVINRIRGTTKVFPRDLGYCLKRDADTVFINFTRSGYVGFPRFSTRFERCVFWGGTVTYLNLQLAYFLGSREIILVGVDHHYNQHTERDSVTGSVIISGSADTNHFHGDYFGPGYRYHDPRVDRMEVAYREARRFFDRHGCTVLNATVGGRLEVFPRTAFDALLRERRRN